jgi:hypothetical protein
MARARRVWFLVTLYLMMGGVVSVAVAWGFALSVRSSIRLDVVHAEEVVAGFDRPTPPWVVKALGLPESAPRRFLRIVTKSLGVTIDEVEGFEVEIARSAREEFVLRHETGGILRHREYSYGWPFRAASRIVYEFDLAPWGLAGKEQTCVHAGEYVTRWRNQGSPVYLPTRPKWLGLAGNSVVYAIVLAGLVATLGLLARLVAFIAFHRQRARAGLCPSCRYPRGVSPVCTECGEKLA